MNIVPRIVIPQQKQYETGQDYQDIKQRDSHRLQSARVQSPISYGESELSSRRTVEQKSLGKIKCRATATAYKSSQPAIINSISQSKKSTYRGGRDSQLDESNITQFHNEMLEKLKQIAFKNASQDKTRQKQSFINPLTVQSNELHNSMAKTDKISYQIEIHELKEKYKIKCEELESLKNTVYNSDQSIQKRMQNVLKQEIELQTLTTKLEQKAKLIQFQQKEVEEQKQKYEQLNKSYEQQLQQIEQQQSQNQQKEQQLEKLGSSLDLQMQSLEIEKNNLKDWQTTLNEKSLQLQGLSNSLHEREILVEKNENSILVRDRELTEQIRNLKEHENILINLEQKLENKIKGLSKYQEQLYRKLLQLDTEDENKIEVLAKINDQFKKKKQEQEIETYFNELGKLRQKEIQLEKLEKSSFSQRNPLSQKKDTSNLESYLYD